MYTGSSDKKLMKMYFSTIPLERFGTRTEIGESCLYLCSPVSSYTTGAMLVVDGGQWMASLPRFLSKL